MSCSAGGTRRCSEPEEDHDCLIQAHLVLDGKVARSRAELRFRYRGSPVDHEAALSVQPFFFVGSTGSRNSGASIGSVENAQIVIERVAWKWATRSHVGHPWAGAILTQIVFLHWWRQRPIRSPANL